MNKLVSIIIPTLNSAQFLPRTLDSVFAQTYKNIEVILVDGGSTDETINIATKYNLRIIKTDGERSVQKNLGAQNAKGEYLYFVDSDFILNENIVSECIDKSVGIDMIAVHNTSDPTVSFWSRVRKFERDLLKYDRDNISPRFLKKSAFESVNGFNAKLVAGEDYDIYNRLLAKNFKLGFIDAEEMHLGEPKNIREIISKHYYYGQTLGNVESEDEAVITFWQKSPIKKAYIKYFYKFILKPHLAFGLVIYNFVRYAAAIGGYLRQKKKPFNNELVSHPLVSVIIPTLNGSKFIIDCLKSIYSQTYKNIEVIVVDGASTDNTIELIKQNFHQVKLLISPKGRGRQVNLGVKNAKGEYVYRVGNDFVLDPEVIEQCMIAIQNGADMIAVHNTSNPKVSFWSKVRKFERDMYRDDVHNVVPRFMSKKIWESVGGLNEDLIAAEDYHMYNKLREKGYKLGFIKAEEMHMDEHKNLIDVIRKFYFYGQSIVTSPKRDNNTLIANLTFAQKFPVRPAFIKNWYRFILHPILTIGLVIYLNVKFTSGAIGYLSARIRNKKVEDKTFR